MEYNFEAPYQLNTSAYDIQAQKLIFNVLHFIRETRAHPELLIGWPSEVAARALNINRKTFKNLSDRIEITGELQNPRHKITKTAKKVFDDFDIDATKQVITELFRCR
jgi:hypothetical protein